MDLEGDPSNHRVVVAMSGGVDSSVTAALLVEAGYEVVGLTMQLYDYGKALQKKGACCAGSDINDARLVSSKLGIPHYVLNYESIFQDQVMNDFADSYLRGETPIPCVRCNQTVKFTDMFDRAKNNPLIDIMVNKSIDSIIGSQKEGVSSIVLNDTVSGEKTTFECEGVFYGIGHNPNTDLFDGVIDLDDNGYIITKPDSSLTNIPGVFACGDVQDDHYRQAITAAGSGCMAAIDAEKYLEDIE